MERLRRIDDLTLIEMIDNYHLYSGLPEGLSQLPVPDYIKIKRKKYFVPKDLDELTNSICYGQRLFIARKEDNDFGTIIRIMDCYYYPLVTKKKWDEDEALLFGKIVLNLKVKDLYPIATHFVKLIEEMTGREYKLLHREPSKIEIAAGIEELNVFSDLSSLDFLSDAMKCSITEASLAPYKECLVRFMKAKKTNDYQEKYFELQKEMLKTKPKIA